MRYLSTNRPTSYSKRRHAAFSLLEVAIALAIFVFGALAIVRIFPSGLSLIQSSGDQQAALNISRSTLADYQKEPFRVPEATYDNNLDGSVTYNSLFIGAILASPRRANSLPSNVEPLALLDSALGHLKVIRGEGATIHEGPTGSFYILTQFPISGSFQISENAVVDAVEVDRNGNLDFSKATVENTTPPLSLGGTVSPSFLPFTIDCDYYISYSRTPDLTYISSSVEDEKAYLDPASSTYSIMGAVPAANRNINPGVVRVVIRRKINQPVSTLPLNQQIAEKEVGYISNFSGNLLSTGNKPIKSGDHVLVDYEASWDRILQEGVPDSPVESTFDASLQPQQITVGAPSIVRRNPDSVVSLVFNQMTGDPFLARIKREQIEPISPIPATEPTLLVASDKNELKSDFRAGRVNFRTSGNFSGAKVRVSFITEDYWTRQLSVAARTYAPESYRAASSAEAWREYKVVGNRLSFLPMDAGKSVLVSFTSVNGRNLDKMFTISDKTDADGRHSFALLDDAGSPAISIQSVRGASMIVRTAYLSGNRYKQAFVSAMRPQGDSQ